MIYAADCSIDSDVDSSHVAVRFAPFERALWRTEAEVSKQTKTPIVYRLYSRPIMGTMEIIERTNYDSEKYRVRKR